ncbi:MAG TPA: hypothetical protein PL143_06185 [Rhodocyclaceae bacterium]|nr:hypothetical protein [Rhodocyclaceae bacterium]
MQRSARLAFIAVAVVSILPFVAAYVAFFVWPPDGTVNYGELIAPDPLPEAILPGLAGQSALNREAMTGNWTLVYAGPGACGSPCIHALYAMRQSRRAQGRDMARVARVWLVTDAGVPDPGLLREHAELRVVRADPRWLERLPAAERGEHVFLVDPLGNVMMRFPQRPDIARVIDDLKRLLKFSSVG